MIRDRLQTKISIKDQNNPTKKLFRFLVLMVIAIYAGMLIYLWDQTESKVRNDLEYINSYLVQAVRTTLKQHELMLRGIGSELLDAGVLEHPQRGRRLIERIKKIDPGMVGFGIARPDGQLVLVTGVDKSKTLPNLLADPRTASSFRETLDSKHLRTGRPYFFKLLGKWVVPIRVTLRDKNNIPRAVMIAGYAINSATTAWSGLALLPGIKVALVGADGYPRYAQPLPAGPRQAVLEKIYGQPISAMTLNRLSRIKPDRGFLQIFLPHSDGNNYLMFQRVPEYGLEAGAFIPRSVVIWNWLEESLLPTFLILLVLVSGTFAYRRTIQQQARSGRAIRQLSAWQQAVLDGADYSIISTDTDGTIATFNKTAETMLGYRAEEMIGKQTPAIFHDPEEIVERAKQLSQELQVNIEPGFEVFVAKAKRGTIDEREWTYIHRDGSRIPVRLSVTPLTTDDSGVIGFLGIADNLSLQKTIQSNLRDSEARYRTLFVHASDAHFLVSESHFIDCNPMTLKMFGCTREQIIGQTPLRYSPEFQPDGRSSAEKAMEKIQAAYDGATQVFEWRHIRFDGTPFETEVTLSRVELRGQPHLLATVRDITARKTSQIELERSRHELMQHNESLRLLNQISNRLHGKLSLDDILNETMEALLGLSNAPNVAIYLMESESDDTLTLVANHGFPNTAIETGSTLPLENSLSGLALRNGKVLVTPDIIDDMRIYPALRKGLSAMGAKTGIIIPLYYQNRPLGTVNLIYTNITRIDQLEKQTLASLGNALALAIANARHMESLAHQARHDSLTNLPNRVMLHETLNLWIKQHARDPSHISLLLLDLDRFKDINDTLGHQLGDRVLTMIGERLNLFSQQHLAFTSRLGGDEFAIVLRHNDTILTTLNLAEEILQLLRKPFLVKGIELSLGASIGVANYPEHGKDSHDLLRSADVAMYKAKQSSSRLIIYNPEFDDYTTERLTLANDLIQAVNEGQLVLHYQPKISLESNEIIGFEALVRWNHPRKGLLFPGDFIYLAEMSEIIHPFTRSIIDLAVRDKQYLHQHGYKQSVAINLSAINLSDMRCLNSLQQALVEYQVPEDEIEVELTETALMHEAEHSLAFLDRLRTMGIKIAIDDFGTGYSSLSHLRRLPISALKIDRSFVMDMSKNTQDLAIVRSTIELAHNLELSVIAEGVETDEVLSLLRSLKCDHAQGYGICRPQPISELIKWLDARSGATLDRAKLR